MAKLLRPSQVLDAVEVSKATLYRLLEIGALAARDTWRR